MSRRYVGHFFVVVFIFRRQSRRKIKTFIKFLMVFEKQLLFNQ